MQVEEKRISIDSRWFSAEREVKRSKGLHLSHVIDFIENPINPRGEEFSPVGHSYAAVGFLWERLLNRLIHHSPEELFEWVFTAALLEIANPDVIRPGEQCRDAGPCPCGGLADCAFCLGTGQIKLYMTPDGLHLVASWLEEWKWTTKSSRGGIVQPKFDRWIRYQIPVYLYALYLRQCRLRVCFSRGDYTSGEPQWMEYLLEYTDQEIEEVWESICLNAAALVRILIGGSSEQV